MTVLIGYVPTPVGEAALAAGLAEAAARGEDVVILNSPRRGSTVDANLVGRRGRGRGWSPLRPRAASPPRVDHADHGSDIVDAFSLGRREPWRPAGRHRPASSLARRQAGHGQRRPATAARARRAGAGRQARPMSPSRISRVVVTPVAFADPPLLNVVGVHQPWALRAIVEVHTDSGLLGLGETYADEAHLARLGAVAAAIPGIDPFDLAGLRRVVVDVLGRETGGAGASFGGMLDVDSAVDTVYSPFEVACIDLQGHETGRPVSRGPGRAGARPPCRSAATSSTSGPATPASRTTRGARR